MRFEIGTYEFDLDHIDLSNGCEGAVTTIFEQKLKKNKEKNGEMNSTTDDSKLNQSKLSKISLELNREDEKDKENKNLKMDDIFFEKSGKQNASLNGLPSFEEVYDIHPLELNFEPKNYETKQFNSKSSTKLIYNENLIASEMGTTANIMLIKNGIIYIANVGDSLSVMYKNKKAYNLNKEHQTIMESEKQRVIKSGANIVGYRINGMLNLTRAIGDLRFKSNANLKIHEQSVISLPEITKIEDTDGIDFIIMGCDGVWDCVKRQMVCDFVDKEIKEHPEKNLSEILAKIFDRCVSPVWGLF